MVLGLRLGVDGIGFTVQSLVFEMQGFQSRF